MSLFLDIGLLRYINITWIKHYRSWATNWGFNRRYWRCWDKKWSRFVILSAILLLYIFVVSVLVFILAVSVGRGSRFSYFFDDDVEKFSTNERQSEMAASFYLKSRKEGFPSWSINQNVKNPFCITIVTKKRPHDNYIIRSTGYLLHRLEALERNYYKSPLPIKVFISNANRPKTDDEVLPTLRNAIDIVDLEDSNTSQFNKTIVGSKSIPFVLNQQWPEAFLWRRNEILDVSLILEYSEYLGCEYVMILEDDGIVSNTFYTNIQENLNQLLKLPSSNLSSIHSNNSSNSKKENNSSNRKKDTNFFALKLFYSDTFSGWSDNLNDFSLLISSTGLVTICFAVFIPIIIGIHINRKLTFLLLIYFWIFFICIFLAVGKQWIFPPFQGKGILKLPRRMGSTVGVVYPRSHFIGLSNYLKDHVRILDSGKFDSRNVDLLIDEYADVILNLDTYLSLPNVVQHIGRYSSSISKNQGSIKFMSVSNTFPKSDEAF